MKHVSKIVVCTLAIIAVIVIISILLVNHSQPMQKTVSSSVQSLTLTSTAFANNTPIPDIYSCTGENINPELTIGDVDANAKSLVLIVDDPDAPNGTFDHWIKFNIPPETQIIEEGKEPEGVSGKGSAGNLTYTGPCPPSGTHRYFFKVYALDTTLNLDEGVSKKEVQDAINGHILEQAQLIGLYSKK